MPGGYGSAHLCDSSNHGKKCIFEPLINFVIKISLTSHINLLSKILMHATCDADKKFELSDLIKLMSLQTLKIAVSNPSEYFLRINFVLA